MRIRTALHCAMVAAMLSWVVGAQAASGTWNVDAAGNWSTAGNWTPAVVPGTAAGDTVGLTYDITASRTVTMDTTSRTVGTLNLGDSGSSYFAYTLTNSGGTSLTFNNSGSRANLVQTATTASDIIAVPITLTDNLSVSNNSTLTLSGVISGGKSIAKSGTGTLTLSGVNTFNGGMTNLQGTVSVGMLAGANVAQPLGAVASVTLGSSGQNATLEYSGPSASVNLPFIFAAGGTGTFQIDNAGTILTRGGVALTGGGGLIKSGAGTLQISSVDNYSGNTTVNAGILRLDTSSNPNTTYYLNGGILANNAGTFNRPVIVTADGSGVDGISAASYSGTLTSSGGNYTLNINASSVADSVTIAGTVTPGAGLTLLLDVQKGSLLLGNSTAFATNTVSLQLESAAILDMNKLNATFGALSGSGTVSDTGGGGAATSTLTLAGTNSATFSGVIVNGTKTTALVKTNTGTQTLSGSNTFTGGTTISGGTLAMGTNNVFANSGAWTLNGGTFSSQGYSNTLGALTIQASSTVTLGTNTTGRLTFASGIYTAGILSINNWTGTFGQSGTANRIFITASPSTTFLTNITFTGYAAGAIRLGTGEIVPAGALIPTKLAITSVNGGSSPTYGTAFNVVIQTQDSGGTARTVTADTSVTLSLNTGLGTLGGTLTGTIAAGTSSVTISGVTYGKAESGVILTATRISGDTLTAGNSGAFTVNMAMVTVASGLSANNKVYDTATTATISSNTVVLSGVIAGDTNNVRLSTNGYAASFASATVGSGKTVTVSGLTLTGSAAANYSLTQPTATANITVASTLNALTSSLNPALPGSNITFTATLTVGSPGSGTPTGNVIFKDGTTALGTNTLSGSGVAIFSTASLSHGSHTIIAEYAGDANFFGSTNSLSQSINTRPLAATDTLPRYQNSDAKVRITTVLSNDSDADGDVLTFSSVSATSAAGGLVVVSGPWIRYARPAGFTNSDSFSYVMADSGGLQATGSVSVTILANTATSQNAITEDLGNNATRVRFAGIPGRAHTIQYAENLVTPDWQTLATQTADATGSFEHTDTPPQGAPARFYRSTHP